MEKECHYIALTECRDVLAAGLPVLTYHKIAHRPRGVRVKSIYLSPNDFRRQLTELAAAGFTSGSLDDPRPLAGNPDRKIVLTFDDGYRNVLTNAAPLLQRHGFRAVQYLVADRLGGVNDWDTAQGEVPEPLMTEAEVRTWLALGHEIGAHTRTHPHLPRLSRAQAREEIAGSRKKLEDILGRPVRHFCYPYGEWNEELAELASEAGYTTATTTRWGANLAATPAFALHRLNTRYRSRNLRNTWRTLLRCCGLSG